MSHPRIGPCPCQPSGRGGFNRPALEGSLSTSVGPTPTPGSEGLRESPGSSRGYSGVQVPTDEGHGREWDDGRETLPSPQSRFGTSTVSNRTPRRPGGRRSRAGLKPVVVHTLLRVYSDPRRVGHPRGTGLTGPMVLTTALHLSGKTFFSTQGHSEVEVGPSRTSNPDPTIRTSNYTPEHYGKEPTSTGGYLVSRT